MDARLPFALAVLLFGAMSAPAQTRAPQPAAPPAKQATARAPASAVDPNSVVQAALTVAQRIDQGQVTPLWQGASPVARATTTEKQFVDGINGRRKGLGTPLSREWTSVVRSTVAPGDKVPAGAYVSARFQTRFSGNRVAEELVSLHYDDDGTWRLAGYTIK
ncbi:DUF4019 domain-containing protein [Lysobacter arvi]|uniref:DUF4019 domain-containing protein n=1 Tax=Lysobacter arvi TaxID=3038776 RepID=A0ABU1CCG1_9GAMM|nr:DUF4019 domain-containing protein [Lysobacter arvi]MDR0182881.1 DUF4019 domain-containing protein [Lysobacter arvi]